MKRGISVKIRGRKANIVGDVIAQLRAQRAERDARLMAEADGIIVRFLRAEDSDADRAAVELAYEAVARRAGGL